MSLRTMFDRVEATLDGIAVVADAATSARASGLPRAEIRRRNEAAIASQLLRAWSLHIEGSHYSGLSNQKLLEVFRDRDERDYAANTVQLTQARRSELRRAFASLGRLAEVSEIEATDAQVILTWIVKKRLGRGNGDLLFPRLRDSTLRAKARAGRSGQAIGVETGEWRDAIERTGRITFAGSLVLLAEDARS